VRVEVEAESGRFVIELRPDWAPTTVARFLGLVDDGFYDGLTFHRVVPAFVVQGGDPRGDGYGGPGWSQRCEDNRVPYERGTVGMALAGRDTGGSQFFITLAPQPHLDGRYTAFGRVVEGMEVVERVLRGEVMRRVRRQQNHD
jgi:cyclophilin family peptidyl-prolyl cis-trans isomerase